MTISQPFRRRSDVGVLKHHRHDVGQAFRMLLLALAGVVDLFPDPLGGTSRFVR